MQNLFKRTKREKRKDFLEFQSKKKNESKFGLPLWTPLCIWCVGLFVCLFAFLFACVFLCVCVCVFGKDVLLVKTRINLKTERYVDTQVSQDKIDVFHENIISKGTLWLTFWIDQYAFQPHDLSRGANIGLWTKRTSILYSQFCQSSSLEHMIWSICCPYDS